MKIILLFSFFLLISCSKKSLLQDWSNIVDEQRTINLKQGKIGKNKSALKVAKDCHFDIEVKGREDAGHINVIADAQVKEHCHDKVPVKMMYNVLGDKMKVCSDYADGRHNCEMMKKKTH